MNDVRVPQVGGSHYEANGLQHWDIMERYDISYLEATATKYVVRYDRKGNPDLDLEKACSYLERVLVERRGVRRTVELTDLNAFYEANKCDSWKREVLNRILHGGYMQDLGAAIDLMRERRAELQAAA